MQETAKSPTAVTDELLGRDAIFGADDIRYQIVDVPEWGGKVRLKSMTSRQRDAFEKSLVVGKGKKEEMSRDNIRAKFLVRIIVDSAGNQLFSDEDADQLAKKSAAATSRLYTIGAKMSGLTEEDVEELAKNSGSVQEGSSSST